jgi:hypothetical protein
MRLKTLAVLMLALVALPLVAGCGSSKKKAGTTSTTSPTAKTVLI